MPERLACPNGHYWEVPSAGDSEPRTLACPVCAAAGSCPGEKTTLPDELPPPPRLLPRRLALPTHRNVAGYEILEELGRGGMGVVYKARQLNLNRLVALKMLLAGPHAGDHDMARFRAEAETVARLRHPNIVHIYDVGEQDGVLYLALEYVEGGSLAEHLPGRPQPARAAAQLVQTLARAMHVAHRAGIVHRDLKPANVLLAAEDAEDLGDKAGRISAEGYLPSASSGSHWSKKSPKITDFGLAKRAGGTALTESGIILGTPSYMAPEQAESKLQDIGPATDVYALGAILYEMLTGRPPFQGATALEIVRQVVNAKPIRPSHCCAVPRDLELICLRCLEKNPRWRHGSALDLAEELDRFLQDKTVEVGPIRRGRSPAVWVVALVLGVLLVAGGVLVWMLPGLWDEKAIPRTPDEPPGKLVKNDPSPTAKENKGQGGLPKPTGPPRWEVLQITPAEAEEKFQQIAFPTRQVGYTASNRAVYKTEDAGKTWKPILQAAFLRAGHVDLLRFRDERTGWLVCNYRLSATADGGDTWTPVDLHLRVFDLAVGADGWALVGGTFEPGGFPEGLLSKRGKGNWEDLAFAKKAKLPERIGRLNLIAIGGPDTAWVACNHQFSTKSCVIRTTDGGRSWKTVFQTDVARLSSIHFADLKHGWLMGYTSLWITEDGGDTWKPQLNPEDHVLSQMVFDPHGSFFGLALLSGRGEGKLLMTTDGKQWRSVTLDMEEPFIRAVVVDAGCALVLTADGRLLRYVDPARQPKE